MRLWARVFVLLLWVCGRSDGLSRPIIPNLKLTTLEFYMHDNVTQPATSITVAGPNGTLTGFHFGTINVIDDLITEGPSAYSKVLGRGRGTYAQCSLQIDTVLMSFSAVLDSEKYKGSISFHGAENIFQTTRDVAVVGGTGDFLLAQGFATISSVYFVGPDALLHFKDVDSVSRYFLFEAGLCVVAGPSLKPRDDLLLCCFVALLCCFVAE